MAEHDLKVRSDLFPAVQTGEKPFEVRMNDRDYQVGDRLRLRDYDEGTDTYSGAETRKVVTYILHGGQFGIAPGWCIMGIRPLLVGDP